MKVKEEWCYTTSQLAQMFCVSDETIRRYAKQGLLPAFRLGNKILYPEKDILQIVAHAKEEQRKSNKKRSKK